MRSDECECAHAPEGLECAHRWNLIFITTECIQCLSGVDLRLHTCTFLIYQELGWVHLTGLRFYFSVASKSAFCLESLVSLMRGPTQSDQRKIKSLKYLQQIHIKRWFNWIQENINHSSSSATSNFETNLRPTGVAWVLFDKQLFMDLTNPLDYKWILAKLVTFRTCSWFKSC